ncbi:hypothetical protein [Dongia sp.]|uniref:hypothetical protein n=1 Tax=Dongia sp. TaxID=1977262 RepID=UPI00375280BE
MHDHTTMLPVIPVDEPVPIGPRTADLPLGRVLLALAVAPLLGAALMTLGVHLVNAFEGSGVGWKDLTLSMLAPIAWSMICGMTYLRTVSRLRDQIAWHECLLLGCASSFLMPLVYDIVGTLLLQGRFPLLDWAHLKNYAFAGLFTLPFGLLGGWLFWRIAVRPADIAMRDLSGVFD